MPRHLHHIDVLAIHQPTQSRSSMAGSAAPHAPALHSQTQDASSQATKFSESHLQHPHAACCNGAASIDSARPGNAPTGFQHRCQHQGFMNVPPSAAQPSIGQSVCGPHAQQQRALHEAVQTNNRAVLAGVTAMQVQGQAAAAHHGAAPPAQHHQTCAAPPACAMLPQLAARQSRSGSATMPRPAASQHLHPGTTACAPQQYHSIPFSTVHAAGVIQHQQQWQQGAGSRQAAAHHHHDACTHAPQGAQARPSFQQHHAASLQAIAGHSMARLPGNIQPHEMSMPAQGVGARQALPMSCQQQVRHPGEAPARQGSWPTRNTGLPQSRPCSSAPGSMAPATPQAPQRLPVPPTATAAPVSLPTSTCPYEKCPGVYTMCGEQLAMVKDPDGMDRWACRACDFTCYGVAQDSKAFLALELQPPPQASAKPVAHALHACAAEDSAASVGQSNAAPSAAIVTNTACAAGQNHSKQQTEPAALAGADAQAAPSSPLAAWKAQARRSQSPKSALSALSPVQQPAPSSPGAAKDSSSRPSSPNGKAARTVATPLAQTMVLVKPIAKARSAVHKAGGVAALMRKASIDVSGAHITRYEVQMPFAEYDSLVQQLRNQRLLDHESGAVPPWVLDTFRGNVPKVQAKQVDEAVARMPQPLLHSLMPFQVEGVRFGLERAGRCLIGDEMGAPTCSQDLSDDCKSCLPL